LVIEGSDIDSRVVGICVCCKDIVDGVIDGGILLDILLVVFAFVNIGRLIIVIDGVLLEKIVLLIEGSEILGGYVVSGAYVISGGIVSGIGISA